MEKLMTTQETAAYLGIHEITAWRLAKTKKIPCFKVGGCYRFSKETLDAFFKKQMDECK